ncbi:MAG: histidine kinase [Firmicutes bacterium]|nr:histidine kinase [Bacillota bacterium]
MSDRTPSHWLLTSHALAAGAGVAFGALIVGILEGDHLAFILRAIGWWHAGGAVVFAVLFVILCFLALLVTVVWIAFRGTAEFRSRLSKLADASSLFAAGSLQYRIEMSGDDDLALTANRLNAMAQKLQEQVRALQDAADDNLALRQDAVVAATIQERARVQRELHDRVSQDLFGLAMLCTAADAQRTANPEAALSLLPELRELASRTQAAMRSLLLELRPQQLGDRDLAAALRTLTTELSARTGVVMSYEFRDDRLDAARTPLAQSVEDALFLIAQEASINALKHAHAHAIGVELYIESHRVVLRIYDDGKGMSAFGDGDAFTDTAMTSVGLQSMSERAQLLGGTCVISNRTDGGVQVLTVIPIVRGGGRVYGQ